MVGDIIADSQATSPGIRTFAAETVMTPAKAVERLRLEAARERVESSPSRSSWSRRKPGLATPSGCGARLSAPLASRRRRCAAPRRLTLCQT
jgi:hypothetical protein